MVEMNAEQYGYAMSQLREASSRLNRVNDLIEDEELETKPSASEGDLEDFSYYAYLQSILVDCHISIELVTKALFLLLGLNTKTSHGVSFTNNESSALLDEISKNFDFNFKEVEDIS